MLRERLSRLVNRQMKRVLVERVGIDLGTVNTLIYREKQGIVLNEPSAVALNKFSGEVLAVGREALGLLGREPVDTVVHRPMKDGSIANYDLAEKMLKAFMKLAGVGSRFRFLHIVTGTPNLSTSVERRALKAASKSVGARWVSLVEEGMAAALGSGLMSEAANAGMVVDIGGGTTDITIASSSGIIYSTSIPVAGNTMNHAVLELIHRKYRMQVGEQTAEQVKIELGAARLEGEERFMRVVGKSHPEFNVREFNVSSTDVVQALEKSVSAIIDGVRLAVEQTSPNVAVDLYRNGITLTGGGGLLRGLDSRLAEELQLPVTVAKRPLEAVVLGIGKLISNPQMLERYQVKEDTLEWEAEKSPNYSAA